MKKSTILLICVFILGATSLIYALQQSAKDKIIHGFNIGDAELIASFCEKESLLELFDAEEYEGKTSIKKRLEDFFTQYPPRSFKVQHEGGKDHPGKDYIIGVLQSEGEVFRVTLAIKHKILTDINIIFEAPAG
jgi:hypothetical protein